MLSRAYVAAPIVGKGAKRMAAAYLLLPLIFTIATTSVSAEVSVTLDGTAITAEGLSANDRAIIFGLARTVENSVNTTVQETRVVDTDTSGEVEHESDYGNATHSVWIVVDLATGEYGSAVAPGMPVEELLGPGGNPINLGQLISGKLIADLIVVDLLIVRPGAGAWSAHIGDGGPGDTDGGRDGVLSIDPIALQSLVDGVEPPTQIQGGDVVALVNTRSFAHTVVAIGS
jgi:hypothetical protein